MLRGKVTNVTSAGVYVQTADFGTVGPCQAVVANYAVGDMVLLSNVGSDAAPDLVVAGKLTADGVAADMTARSYRAVGTTSVAAVGYFDAPTSGYSSALRFRTGTSNRWFVGKTSAVESGSNAGSNLQLYAYDDSGAGLGVGIEISRATRKVTIGAPGTTAGIELGSGGPTITTGTGAPSHSAPNGSVYLRTDGTATTTLYVRASGAWTALS